MDKLGLIALTRTPALFTQLTVQLEGELPDGSLAIVVNNASSLEITETAVRNHWACIDAGRNLSFSEGNNVAAKVAMEQGCTHLLLMNDDVLADANFVRKLWDNRTASDNGVLGATLIHTNGTVNHAGALVYPNCNTDHMGRHDKLELWERNEIAAVAAVTFACVLIPVALWQQLQGLDTRYLWGWEDTDFCMRVLEAGGTCYVHRGAVAIHDECGTRARGSLGDHANLRLFRDIWQDRLPALLHSYFDRENVEGITP